ncbi:asialoglycoprotein receptor 1 [Puntigrus tetrazona]|uniref:asialoglycoprotein receptor 1 n=1 Tax=Puntigrus tetrazona TaxID=1606681 RepID=UPI001C89D250|nr:asialoglycoprotein receptor 1 [Puntigrus tetrazona]XP_043088503.1 asialoglycoprotein receptor 1 [Puntigrus tetrazona]XP_043088504.1 asialoglycoprotein receptor 1 [Puntigrus tetrazona]XP_043088505.1 asialoglycoprotein receptor 1 [Puntigrus tetrazona]
MKAAASERGSGSEYTDEFENHESSDDTEFWRKESSLRMVGSSGGRWRCRFFVSIGVTALILLLLIITVSVSPSMNHVKFDRKFATTEMNVQNLTQTLASVVTRTRDLENHGNKLLLEISSLEFDQVTMESMLNNMLDSVQELRDRVSDLKCQINKLKNNNTQELCCPEGWLLFSSHCYFFSNDGMPWDAAKDECKKKRSELLVLKSKPEKTFVVSKTRPLYYWLGLSDARTGEWEWLDRTPYTIIRSEWMPGQPDDWKHHGLGGGEDCAHFHHDGRYNDDHCSRHYRYVCKAHASSI